MSLVSVHVDIILLAAIITALMTISTPIIVVVRCYTKITRALQDNTKAIRASKKERRVLMQGVQACLYGLQEHGCNGPVTDNIKKMDQFLIDQLHEISEDERG